MMQAVRHGPILHGGGIVTARSWCADRSYSLAGPSPLTPFSHFAHGKPLDCTNYNELARNMLTSHPPLLRSNSCRDFGSTLSATAVITLPRAATAILRRRNVTRWMLTPML